jgi:hypothetical protein
MNPLRQQVNLYQRTVPAWRPFGSATLALAAGAVGCCLAVIWAFGTWQLDRLQKSVGTLQRQQDAQQAALSALGSLPADGAGPADLQSRIQALSAELATRERALALLQMGAAGSTTGFSGDLAALARHPVPGLWLRQVDLSRRTDSISLSGEVLSPDEVPRYLRALAAEHALAGMRFDRLLIERPGAGSPASGSASPRRHSPVFDFSAAGTAASPAQPAAAQEPHS